jgi:hypothetical protein
MSPIDVGILPLKLLPLKTNRNNLFNLPISDGILPLKRLSYNCKLVKLARFPKLGGIDPVTLMLFIIIDSTFELPSHVTLVHGVEHTDVKGTPPLHRQPATVVNVPRFVDAVKSQSAVSDKDIVGNGLGFLLGVLVGVAYIPTGD